MLHELHYPILKELGLTETEALIYEVLLEQGPKPAKDLVIPSGLSRGNVYNALTALVKKGLATEKTGTKTIYEAAPPANLASLLEMQKKQLKQLSDTFQEILPSLSADYRLSTNKPVIKFYEGVNGLKKIFDEILTDGQELFLIRAANEPVYQEKILPIIDQFVKNRIKKNIPVTAITPFDSLATPEKDKQWLMSRFMVDKKMYDSPVEIDIFGNKVAILSFGDELIGMIVDSPQIARSLMQIFILATLGTSSEKTKL